MGGVEVGVGGGDIDEEKETRLQREPEKGNNIQRETKQRESHGNQDPEQKFCHLRHGLSTISYRASMKRL